MTKVLGEQVSHPITASDLDVIDTIDPAVQVVSYRTKELTAKCPVTGQPDHYTLKIGYRPNGKTIESKSLKLYLWSFAGQGIYAENLAARIANDLSAALREDVTVELEQQVRGGLILQATAVGRPIMGSVN